jgi:hypothetical protein
MEEIKALSKITWSQIEEGWARADSEWMLQVAADPCGYDEPAAWRSHLLKKLDILASRALDLVPHALTRTRYEAILREFDVIPS